MTQPKETKFYMKDGENRELGIPVNKSNQRCDVCRGHISILLIGASLFWLPKNTHYN